MVGHGWPPGVWLLGDRDLKRDGVREHVSKMEVLDA